MFKNELTLLTRYFLLKLTFFINKNCIFVNFIDKYSRYYITKCTISLFTYENKLEVNIVKNM